MIINSRLFQSCTNLFTYSPALYGSNPGHMTVIHTLGFSMNFTDGTGIWAEIRLGIEMGFGQNLGWENGIHDKLNPRPSTKSFISS